MPRNLMPGGLPHIDPSEAIDADALEKALREIADAAASDIGGVVDGLTKRLDVIGTTIKKLGPELAALEKRRAAGALVDPDDLKRLIQLRKQMEALKIEASDLPSFIEQFAEAFQLAANSSTRLGGTIDLLRKRVKPKDWDAYAKAIGLSKQSLDRIKASYEQASKAISANNKFLREQQAALLEGKKLRADDAKEIARARVENEKLGEVVSVISDVVDEYRDLSIETEQVVSQLSKVTQEISAKEWETYRRSVAGTSADINKLTLDYEDLTKQLNALATEQRDLIAKRITIGLEAGEEKRLAEAVEEYGKLADKKGVIESVVQSARDLTSETSDALSIMRTLGTTLSIKEWRQFQKITGLSADEVANVQQKYSAQTEELKKNTQQLLQLQTKQKVGIKLSNDEEKQMGELAKAIQQVSDEREGFVQLVMASSDAVESFEKQVDRTTILGKVSAEAQDEVDRLAGGLGETATGALAAGIALIYVAGKIKEFGESIEDTNRKWAEYNAQTAITVRTMPDFSGGIAGLDELRVRLRMTSSEALEFQETLKRGASTGVASVEQLVEAAEKLAEAFGDDPTRRLENYVDLLKEIPTLETDLTITASLDDQAAAWFAIAERGRVRQVIELQTAGLLGAEELIPPEGTEAEIATLKAIRETEVVQENIEKAITGWIGGSWVPWVTKSLAFGAQAGAIGWTLVTSAAVMKKLLMRVADNTGETARKVGGIGKGAGADVRFMDMFKRELAKGRLGRLGGRIGAARTGLAAGGRALGGGLMARGGAMAGPGAGLATTVVGKATAGLGTVITGLSTEIGGITAAVGPLGAAATAVAGALGVVAAAVGPFVLAGKYGEVVGEKLKETAEDIEDTNFNKILTQVLGGPALTALNVLGVEGLTAADAMKFAGEQAELVGKWWSDAGSAIYDWLFVSEKQRKAQEEAADAALERAKQEIQLREELRKMQVSALELEKALGFIAAATESPITALAQLGTEVSELRLEELRELGGTALEFREALEQGAVGITREFDQMNRAFGKARNMIIGNASLNAEHRRAALLKLHKAELEATAKFIKAMSEMVGRFSEIPEVARAELQSGIRKAMIDLDFEIGEDIVTDTFENIVADINDRVKALSASAEQVGKDFELSQEAADKLSQKLRVEGPDLAKTLEGIKKDLSAAGEGLVPEDVDLAEKLKASIDLEGDIEIKESGIPKEIAEKAQERIEQINKQLSGIEGTELVAELSKIRSEYIAAYKEQAAVDKELQAQGELIAELKSYAGTWREKTTEVKKETAKLVSITQKTNAANEKVSKLADEKIAIEEKVIAITKRIIGPEKAATMHRFQLLELGEKQLKTVSQNRNVLERRRAALEELKRSGEKIADIERLRLDSIQRQRKITEAYLEQISGLLGSLDTLVAMIERDPTVQRMQKEIDILEQRNELNALLGKNLDTFAEQLDKQRGVYLRQLKLSQDGLKVLKNLSAGGEAQAKALTKIRTSFNAALTNIGKVFEADEAIKAFGGGVAGKKAADEVRATLADQAGRMRTAYDELRKAFESGEATEEELRNLGTGFSKERKKFDQILQGLAKRGIEIDTSNITGPLDLVSASVKGMAGGMASATRKLTLTGATAETNLAKLAQTWENFLQSLEDDQIIRTARALKSQAEAEIDLAEVTFDTNAAFRAQERTQQEAMKERNRLLSRLETQEAARAKDLAKEIDELKRIGAEEERITLARQQYEEDIAKIAAKKAEVERNAFREIADSIERATEVALAPLEIRKEELDIVEDLAQTLGANLGTMLNIQMQQLSVAREESEVLRKAWEDAVASGVDQATQERLRLRYVRSAAEVQKKALGLQRDAFDKLMERAFGAIRGARGARRQLLTTAQVFGPGYVRGAATGLVTGGGAKTIAARQAAFATTGLGGPRGIAAPRPALTPEQKQEKENADQMTSATAQFSGAVKEFGSIMLGGGGLLRSLQMNLRTRVPLTPTRHPVAMIPPGGAPGRRMVGGAPLPPAAPAPAAQPIAAPSARRGPPTKRPLEEDTFVKMSNKAGREIVLGMRENRDEIERMRQEGFKITELVAPKKDIAEETRFREYEERGKSFQKMAEGIDGVFESTRSIAYLTDAFSKEQVDFYRNYLKEQEESSKAQQDKQQKLLEASVDLEQDVKAPGSIYTHDTHLEALFREFLARPMPVEPVEGVAPRAELGPVAPIAPAGGAGVGAAGGVGAATVGGVGGGIRVEVEVGVTKDGNLTAAVKKITKENMPELLRTNQTTGALVNQGFVNTSYNV